ncbi:MAG: tetratricopeptide repeat protein [Candidatus Promineifilaceae bacterium]|nr:tetratricopeptide repeat protein [Candidatus Promineifilaceae bacterium]
MSELVSDEISRQKAQILWEQAYRLQMQGEIADAIALYKRSIAMHPTAEAYTYLGWAYSMIGLYDKAISLCKKAIEIDPSFGNPYNDIGAYLIELERWEDAIPWLEEATTAPRYASPEYAYLNLGRVYEQVGDFYQALIYYNQALRAAPMYLPAEWARNVLLGKLN